MTQNTELTKRFFQTNSEASNNMLKLMALLKAISIIDQDNSQNVNNIAILNKYTKRIINKITDYRKLTERT